MPFTYLDEASPRESRKKFTYLDEPPSAPPQSKFTYLDEAPKVESDPWEANLKRREQFKQPDGSYLFPREYLDRPDYPEIKRSDPDIDPAISLAQRETSLRAPGPPSAGVRLTGSQQLPALRSRACRRLGRDVAPHPVSCRRVSRCRNSAAPR